jgi:C4-dicarboxylate-specific signal transduction histidine kinase
VEILRENERDLAGFVSQDARGKHLLPFLAQLENALRDQREGIVRELRSLGGGIDHIAELVRAQQTYAGTRGVFERADLAEQIDVALRFCLQADGGHPDFAVEREFEALPKVSIDRHKLMEILVNLIQNARHAMRESRRPDRKLTLRLGAEGERVRIEVADNGCGIPPTDLAKVFHHGFTTKKNGHGFGLHVSANAATELGGRLVAASEGQGRGATFLLDIPLLRPEPALAA